ncbi:MAG: hypothetical protein KJ734_11215, partial [Chloroflexi bacterium]|nr:hypothetical protein [Chloroflexota bacterium]
TTVPISVTRRADLEAIVNARFPIADGHSHWEVWWLPPGETFPIPNQPFRLDPEDWPPPLALAFEIDFVDASGLNCAGCPMEVLAYNGYVFVGPYQTALRLLNIEVHTPLVAFGADCGWGTSGLFPTNGQYITPTVPFTHVLCLENWDTVARTFTIDAASSQGWDYAYYYQEADGSGVPVPVAGVPFTVPVSEWGGGLPGGTNLLAVATPPIAITDTMRETLTVNATSTISPEVHASTVSFALAPGYTLDEGGAQYHLYLPLVLRQ